MKVRLLRKIRRLARKNIYIIEPKDYSEDYYIQTLNYKIPLASFFDENDFQYAEQRVRSLRREFMRSYLKCYKRDKKKVNALKRINRFTF